MPPRGDTRRWDVLAKAPSRTHRPRHRIGAYPGATGVTEKAPRAQVRSYGGMYIGPFPTAAALHGPPLALILWSYTGSVRCAVPSFQPASTPHSAHDSVPFHTHP